MNYVLYHRNCYDGFGAAYAAWKKFGDQDTKYISVSYGEPLPVDLADPNLDEVYIVDFCYPYEILNNLAQFCKKLFVFDHHKTAQAEIKDKAFHSNVEIIFDMKRSGALITWECLHTVWEAPPLIHHISDRDLWEFKLDRSALIHKALVSYPMDFKLWDTFDVEKLKVEGVALERMYSQLVDNICKTSWKGNIDNFINVPMVNTSIAWSEVGQKLLQLYPVADFVASFTEFEKETMWSLRSKENFDCSEVAKQFGGGGHKQASGFKFKKGEVRV